MKTFLLYNVYNRLNKKNINYEENIINFTFVSFEYKLFLKC